MVNLNRKFTCISQKHLFFRVRKIMSVYWRSPYMAWKNLRGNGIRGLTFFFFLIMVILIVTMITMSIIENSLMVHLCICYAMWMIYLLQQKSMSEMDRLKAQLNQEFEMKDLDTGRRILGIEIKRDLQAHELFYHRITILRRSLSNLAWKIVSL